MGPIEQELRTRAEAGQFCLQDKRLGRAAYGVMVDAMFSLADQWDWHLRAGYGVSTSQHWPDIMSEAIEAAEALGL